MKLMSSDGFAIEAQAQDAKDGCVYRWLSPKQSHHTKGAVVADVMGLHEGFDVRAYLSNDTPYSKACDLLPTKPKPVEVTALERVANRFIVETGTDAWRFVVANPNIAPALLSAVPFIEQEFGLGASIALVLVIDPEQNEAPILFCNIYTNFSVDGAITALSNFKKSWWYGFRAQFGRVMNFDVEFD